MLRLNAQKVPLINREIFFDNPEITAAQISPDAKWMTFLKANKGTLNIWVKGVDEPWDVCLVRLFWTVIQNSAQENIRELNERRLFEMQDGLPAGLRDEIEKGFQAAAKDASMIKPLGKLLQDHGLFERFQDRFFDLIQRD